MVATTDTFSQMIYNQRNISKSAFDLTSKKATFLSKQFTDTKVIIGDENNDLTAKRRRSSRRRGGSSEGGLYVSFGLGYGLGLGSQNMTGFNDSTYTETEGSLVNPIPFMKVTYDQINLSLGKGLCINGSVGYMINGNFGVELGLSYLLGGKTTSTQTNEKTTTTQISKGEGITSIQASMVRISPSIIIASGMEGINPYAKFGMTLGFGSFNIENTNTSTNTIMLPGIMDTTIINKTFNNREFSGGLAIGINATLGCSFTMSDNISIFGEFNMINMSYSPSMSEIKEYSINDVDKMSLLTTVAQKQTNYYESLEYSSTSTPHTSDEPSQALKQSISFGSIGLNIGMKITF